MEKQLATSTFNLFLIQEAVSYFGMLKQQLQLSIYVPVPYNLNSILWKWAQEKCLLAKIELFKH